MLPGRENRVPNLNTSLDISAILPDKEASLVLGVDSRIISGNSPRGGYHHSKPYQQARGYKYRGNSTFRTANDPPSPVHPLNQAMYQSGHQLSRKKSKKKCTCNKTSCGSGKGSDKSQQFSRNRSSISLAGSEPAMNATDVSMRDMSLSLAAANRTNTSMRDMSQSLAAQHVQDASMRDTSRSIAAANTNASRRDTSRSSRHQMNATNASMRDTSFSPPNDDNSIVINNPQTHQRYELTSDFHQAAFLNCISNILCTLLNKHVKTLIDIQEKHLNSLPQVSDKERALEIFEETLSQLKEIHANETRGLRANLVAKRLLIYTSDSPQEMMQSFNAPADIDCQSFAEMIEQIIREQQDVERTFMERWEKKLPIDASSDFTSTLADLREIFNRQFAQMWHVVQKEFIRKNYPQYLENMRVIRQGVCPAGGGGGAAGNAMTSVRPIPQEVLQTFYETMSSFGDGGGGGGHEIGVHQAVVHRAASPQQQQQICPARQQEIPRQAVGQQAGNFPEEARHIVEELKIVQNKRLKNLQVQQQLENENGGSCALQERHIREEQILASFQQTEMENLQERLNRSGNNNQQEQVVEQIMGQVSERQQQRSVSLHQRQNAELQTDDNNAIRSRHELEERILETFHARENEVVQNIAAENQPFQILPDTQATQSTSTPTFNISRIPSNIQPVLSSTRNSLPSPSEAAPAAAGHSCKCGGGGGPRIEACKCGGGSNTCPCLALKVDNACHCLYSLFTSTTKKLEEIEALELEELQKSLKRWQIARRDVFTNLHCIK